MLGSLRNEGASAANDDNDDDDLGDDYRSRQAFSERTRAISVHQKVLSRSSDGLHETYFAGKSTRERRRSRSNSIGSGSDSDAADGDATTVTATTTETRSETRSQRSSLESQRGATLNGSVAPSTSAEILKALSMTPRDGNTGEYSLGVDSDDDEGTMALLQAVADGGYDERVVAQAMSPRGRFISSCLSSGLNPRAFMIVRKHEGSTHLALSHMRIGDKVATLFASSLKELENIESVDMNDNKLTDASLRPLVTALAKVQNLRDLDLGGNNIGTCAHLHASFSSHESRASCLISFILAPFRRPAGVYRYRGPPGVHVVFAAQPAS